MPKSFVNNRRIAKNTIFLYIRMLVIMLISLYTVRAFLDILGETDYGLYNVIGGVVAMFSFLNGTLATSSQRYFSVSLVEKISSRINNIFCLNLTIYIYLTLAIVLILETAGLWFVNNKLIIPAERLSAANVVYQISILTFVLQMFSIPFNALLIAHERMKAFAFIGILEALLRLAFVFVLMHSPFDKLVFYAVLMFCLYTTVTFIYIIYCRKHFEESKFKFYWNKREAIEMLGFSGWHFFGTFAVVAKGQGVNILLNMFFGPAVNAARAIAFQVNNAVNQFTSNFFTAVKPQIYKSYAAHEYKSMHELIIRSTILSLFLASVLIVPILLNTQYILGLWLRELPDHVVIFTQLVLIDSLIEVTNGPMISSVLATGKIRSYMIVVSSIIFSILPFSYVALRMGFAPATTMIITIVISSINIIVRSLFLRRMINFPLRHYYAMFFRIAVATVIVLVPFFFLIGNKIGNFFVLALSFALFASMLAISYYLIVLSHHDKNVLNSYISKRIIRKMPKQ